MKRFRFGLERVLAVRRIRVKLRQRELAQALSRYESELRALEAVQERYRWVTGELCQREAGGINAGELRLSRLHVDRLAEGIAARQGLVKAARELLDLCRERLVQEKRGERTLERLRERRRLAYLADVQREEQKVLDEFGGHARPVLFSEGGSGR